MSDHLLIVLCSFIPCFAQRLIFHTFDWVMLLLFKIRKPKLNLSFLIKLHIMVRLFQQQLNVSSCSLTWSIGLVRWRRHTTSLSTGQRLNRLALSLLPGQCLLNRISYLLCCLTYNLFQITRHWMAFSQKLTRKLYSFWIRLNCILELLEKLMLNSDIMICNGYNDKSILFILSHLLQRTLSLSSLTREN